jgi:hypothetical protein
VTKDKAALTKAKVYEDYGKFSSVKNKLKNKTPRPSKKLEQCSKCGRVGDAMTKHSLTGGHKPPFIYLCRQPCHDEVHKFGLKMTEEQKAALKQQPKCSIQFPKEDNIVNPYSKLVLPESLEGEKFKQPFKRARFRNAPVSR